MLDFVQQLVSGIALGCVYGLIALGFVLFYKAAEVVNFAQGDLMMLGGFLAYTFIGILGLNYWIGFAAAVAAMALFGMRAERLVVRPILGYPGSSRLLATGLGRFLLEHGDHGVEDGADGGAPIGPALVTIGRGDHHGGVGFEQQ
jgi:branched-chain amino acid transport system permease protein